MLFCVLLDWEMRKQNFSLVSCWARFGDSKSFLFAPGTRTKCLELCESPVICSCYVVAGTRQNQSPALLGHDEAFLEVIVAHGCHSMACNDLKMNQDESCRNPTLQPTKATHQEIHAKIFETQIIDLCHIMPRTGLSGLFWASLGIPRHPWASLGIPRHPKASQGQASSDLVVRLRHHHLPVFCCLTEAGQHCEAKPRRQH